MNIQKINSAAFSANNQIQTNNINNRVTNFFGLRLNPPISYDTVSFKAKGKNVISREAKAFYARAQARALRDARLIAEAKTAPTKKSLSGEERTWGVPLETAQKIHKKVLEPQKQIHDFLHKVFGDLVVSDYAPKNLLLEIADRAKSGHSIEEKSATLKLNSMREILDNMNDLNGGKLVMNYKTGKPDAEEVLGRLIPFIKTKQITLHEIELQRPGAIASLSKKEQEEFDYFSKAFLDKLEDSQEEVWNGLEENVDEIKLVNRPLPKYTKFNYCALHLTLQINEPGSRPFELQIMGAREAIGKKFDDKRFKFFEGKEIGKEFSELAEFWGQLLTDENAVAKERFFTYWKDANIQVRLDEMHEYATQKLVSRSTGLYITPNKYDLTPEYNLNDLYKTFLEGEYLRKRNEAAAETSVTEKVKKLNKSENLKKNIKR